MSNSLFWDKVRILVTNKCNYRCPFCHNEGQDKLSAYSQLEYSYFKKLTDALSYTNIRELNISGGEPFLHKDIVEILRYACDKLQCDVSCATNLSLIQKEQIEALKGARVKFNIQFPYVSASDFAISTGSSKFAIVIDNIQLIKQCGLSIGLNSVVQNSNTESIRQLINFALLNQLPLKLLPQLGNEDSVKFKEAIYPILTQLATKIVDKKTGAIKFYITDGIHETTVLYIDSPCFTKSFPECKTFGEIRIHPDLEMQTCIFKPSCGKLDISGSSSSIIKQLEAAWNNFVKC